MSVRTNSVMDFYETKHFLNLQLFKHRDRKCKIYLLHGDLTEREMLGLYNNEKIKAYVTTKHGEGFGLPIFEAAQFAIPIIAPRFSGHLDFLYISNEGKKELKFLSTDVEIRHVQPEAVWPGIIEESSMWAYINEDQFREQLLAVVENYNFYKEQAIELKEYLQTTFSKENIYPRLLEDLIGPPSQWQNSLEEINMIS